LQQNPILDAYPPIPPKQVRLVVYISLRQGDFTFLQVNGFTSFSGQTKKTASRMGLSFYHIKKVVCLTAQ